VNVAIIVANFAVWLFYELPHLNRAVFHASFYPGTVNPLRGPVSSWADHDEAVAAAWAAPGVTRVKDHILVAY
jgi:hypothetical protein